MSDDDLADHGHDNHEPLLSQSKREETKQPESVAPKVSKVKSSEPVPEVKPDVKAAKPEVRAAKPEVRAAKPEVRASSKPPVKEKSIEKKEAAIEVDNIKDHESSDDGRSKAKKKSKKRRHTSDQSDSEESERVRKKKKKEKKKKESKKDKDEDDTKKQLQKILLDRLEKGDNDPKLLDLAMQLLGPEKTKPKAVSYF